MAGRRSAAKDGAGEVEEVGHGERVVAHAAMGQQGADVVNEGQIARVPEPPAESDGGEHADDGEDGLRAGEPGGGEQGVCCLAGVRRRRGFLQCRPPRRR